MSRHFIDNKTNKVMSFVGTAGEGTPERFSEQKIKVKTDNIYGICLVHSFQFSEHNKELM